MGSGSSKGLLRDYLTRLSTQDVNMDDSEFWAQLWDIPCSVEDIFELTSSTSIRRLRLEHPQNLSALLIHSVLKMIATVEAPCTESFAQTLLSVRLLTRIIPFLLETYYDCDTGKVDSFSENLLWGESRVTNMSEPLGVLLVRNVMKILFLPKFTVEVANSAERKKTEEIEGPMLLQNPELCWASGLGTTRGLTVYHDKKLEKNRIEIMQLFLVILGKPVFLTSQQYASAFSSSSLNDSLLRFATETTSADCPYAAELFTSLIGVICNFDSIGWGIPFGSTISSDIPSKQLNLAVQLLAVLLDASHPPLPVQNMYGPQESTGDADAAICPPGSFGYNVYRDLAKKCISGKDDFHYVFEGLAVLINCVSGNKSSVRLSTTASVDCYQEVLVLLWLLINSNDEFTEYCLLSGNITRIVSPICFLLTEHRRDPSRISLLYICSFILLKFSGNRSFGVALNLPCSGQIHADLPRFHGSYADLVIVTLQKVIMSGSNKLDELYECFLTIIANMSPYCLSLALVTSVKLVDLFEYLKRPEFLYANETNIALVGVLFECFSNIVQYQYAGNAQLLYAMIRRQRAFEYVIHLSLLTAQADAARIFNASNNLLKVEDDVQSDRGQSLNQQQLKGFVPSLSWLLHYQSQPAFVTVKQLLFYLGSQVDEFCREAGEQLDETRIVEFLRGTTLVGLLPVPHAIINRTYRTNCFTSLWFSAFLWSVIYTRYQHLPLFDNQNIKLFTVLREE